MKEFKFNPTTLPITITGLADGLISFDDVVKIEDRNGTKYAVLNLTEKFDEIQTSISALPTTAAINNAISNALSTGRYVQASTLKSITVNGTEQSLLKSGSNDDTTINITTGSGSGSTVTYTKDATGGVRAGIIKIDGVNNEIFVRFADDNNPGCLTALDYNVIRKGSYINTLGISNVNDDLVYSVFENLGSAGGKVALLSYSNQSYFVYLMALAPRAFTAEGFIKWENNAFSLDANKVFRKYLIVQSTNAASSRVVTLISSSDMFEYTSNTNTLSITTE